MLNGFQLIGDSMLSRLATFATMARPTFNKRLKANQLGLTISGQTAGQLLRLLRSRDCPKVSDNAILMIGTNNVLKKVPSEATLSALATIVETLKVQVQKLIVCTIPPVPKLGNECSKGLVETINSYILSIPKNENVHVLDLTAMFLTDSTAEVNNQMFERDQIHWSQESMRLVVNKIKEAVLCFKCQSINLNN